MRVFQGGLGRIFKRLSYGLVALALFGVLSGNFMFGFGSGAVIAASDQSATCNPVVPASSGVTYPTGSSAGAYTYDKCSGLYTSAHYVYNPATQTYSPLPGSEPIYQCDQSTWRWQETTWDYVASDHAWVQSTFYVTSAPSDLGTCAAPSPPAASGQSQSGAMAQAGTPASPVDSQASQPGNPTDPSGTSSTDLANGVTSSATSGSANSTQNTQAGNLSSGGALASATVVNLVNSNGTSSVKPIATFTQNINGDVNGNIVINVGDLQPSNVDLNSTSSSTSVKTSSDAITNNLDVNANSGTATANANTKVGNVNSGNAAAMVGVVNMLNSLVSAGQSFIGTVNVNGNLNGDILMPAQFLDNLSASGAPHTSIAVPNSDLLNPGLSSTTKIINQINAQAGSGSVDSSRNARSGDATSGNASTKVEIFNLTGQQIVGSNGLLVFVNVAGKWIGLIVGAPSGANVALLGGTITPLASAGSGPTNTNAAITNNINVKAGSGDVASTNNTASGNATSGAAYAAVNVANFANNSISFTGWFGILFINILGNWNGNFGELPTTNQPAAFAVARGPGDGAVHRAVSFGFVPHSGAAVQTSASAFAAQPAFKFASAVKAASIEKSHQPGSGNSGAAPNPSGTHWLIIAASLIVAGCLAAASWRKTT